MWTTGIKPPSAKIGLAICKRAPKGNRKVPWLRLTAEGDWDDDAINSIPERVYGKSAGCLVGYFALGAAFVSDQVRNISLYLRRDFVYRFGVELPRGA